MDGRTDERTEKVTHRKKVQKKFVEVLSQYNSIN